MAPSRSSRQHREAVVPLRTYPSLRDWKARDWAVATFFVALGFLLESILPSRIWGLLGVAAFVAYFVLVARRRGAQREHEPKQDWTPPVSGPGSESQS